MATEYDLLRYLSIHTEEEHEDTEARIERQRRRKNLLQFLTFLWNKRHEKLSDEV
jgi:hypothetical protein